MRASRAQLSLYGTAVVVDTALAVVLGASMAEAAAEIADKNAHAEGDDGSVLSALATAFAWSILAFIYMLCFLSITQCQPKSPLLWIVSEVCALGVLVAFGLGVAGLFTASGMLDMGNCGASGPSYCYLNVAAGALVWVCACLIVTMFAFTILYKVMYHPGRQSWGTSLRTLNRKPVVYSRMGTPGGLSLHPTRTSVSTSANRMSRADGAFSPENEALRPFLLSHESPSVATLHTAGHSTTRSSRVMLNNASLNELGMYDMYGNTSESSLRHSQSSLGPSAQTPWSPTPGRARISLESLPSPSRTQRSRSSLYSAWDTPVSHGTASPTLPPPMPPLPAEIAPIPKDIEAAKEEERALEAEAAAIKAKAAAREVLTIRPPSPGNSVQDEETILTASSDVFSVMADFAPSPTVANGSAAAPKTFSDLVRRSSFANAAKADKTKKEMLMEKTKGRSRSTSTPGSRPEFVLDGFMSASPGGQGEADIVFPGPPPAWTPPAKPAKRSRARSATASRGRLTRTPLPPLPGTLSQQQQQPPALQPSNAPSAPQYSASAYGSNPTTPHTPAPYSAVSQYSTVSSAPYSAVSSAPYSAVSSAPYSAVSSTTTPSTPKRPKLPQPPTTSTGTLPRGRSSTSLPRPPSSSSIASATTPTSARPLPAPPVPPIPKPYRQSSVDAPDGVYMGRDRSGSIPRPLPSPHRASSVDARHAAVRDGPPPPVPPVPPIPPPSY